MATLRKNKIDQAGLSRHTIERYLPVVKAIYSSFELTLSTHNLDHRDSLTFIYLEKEFGDSTLIHAGYLLNAWFKGSSFSSKGWRILKSENNKKWSDMMQIIGTKIMEYENGSAVIEIPFFSNGRILRIVNGKELAHDFQSDGLKKEIISLLASHNDFVQTVLIQRLIGSKSAESVSKIIATINSALQISLQLPANKKFIDNKRGPGYRINPTYNIVRMN